MAPYLTSFAPLQKVWTPTEGNRTRAIMTSGTPNEAKRIKNIASVSTFIKVAPSKPSREEMEEKKQMELLRKREREEESRRKKEELLKSKAEDQKRCVAAPSPIVVIIVL